MNKKLYFIGLANIEEPRTKYSFWDGKEFRRFCTPYKTKDAKEIAEIIERLIKDGTHIIQDKTLIYIQSENESN
jgi:hypothetical protein